MQYCALKQLPATMQAKYCGCIFVLTAETKSHHMQHGSGPSQESGSAITHKIGQNVMVATAVLPKGHNLREKNTDTVNHPWDES